MDIPPSKKLYLHVKDPENHELLKEMKRLCAAYPGNTDIVLVLGEDKRSAIRLPFKADASDGLMGELVKVLSEDCVVLK